MTKIALALAAALIAGTAMTSAANADGVRLGFGFPLGSFVAHSNENYGGGDYRRSERRRYVRRDDQDDDTPIRKIVRVKRPLQAEVAEAAVKAPVAPAQTAKLEDRLASDPATTTVIEKTPAAARNAAPADPIATAPVASADKPAAPETAVHVCRRYSPTVAALVDVPCE